MSRPIGLLNLFKPQGPTSRDLVDRVARPLKRSKVKVGHAGTLDPLASGVLIVAVGGATRLIERLQRLEKAYRAVIRLGATSETLDADGPVVEVENPPIPTEDDVRAALERQVGAIEQRPPAYSALRVGGARAYDLARAGRAVEPAPRTVRIDRVEPLAYTWPRLEIEVVCGSGTYIRSIARDVGEALGCGGLIETLHRSRIGPFRDTEAIDPDTLAPETILERLEPPIRAVPDLPRLALTEDQADAIRQGRPIGRRQGVEPPSVLGETALVGPDDALIALAEADPKAGLYRPRLVIG